MTDRIRRPTPRLGGNRRRPFPNGLGRDVVLDEWCPPIPGLFLSYPGHRQVPAALRAFVDTRREVLT